MTRPTHSYLSLLSYQETALLSLLLLRQGVMYLEVESVRTIGLDFVGVVRDRLSLDAADEKCKHHYGSYPIDLAEIWYDLCQMDEIRHGDKRMRSFK